MGWAAQGGTAAWELGLGMLRARAAGGTVLRGRRGKQGEGPVARSGKWPVGAAQACGAAQRDSRRRALLGVVLRVEERGEGRRRKKEGKRKGEKEKKKKTGEKERETRRDSRRNEEKKEMGW